MNTIDPEDEIVDIACYECRDGHMHLDFDTASVRMNKERFIEFSLMVDRVREILLEEETDERLGREQEVLGLVM